MEVDLYSAFIVVPHTHHNVFTKEMEERNGRATKGHKYCYYKLNVHVQNTRRNNISGRSSYNKMMLHWVSHMK